MTMTIMFPPFSFRIFNISNGKQKKLYKGSQGEDGTLIKVQRFLCVNGHGCGQVLTAFSSVPLRCRLIRQVFTSPPPVQTRTSAYLTSTQESVWPPCSDTQVRNCMCVRVSCICVCVCVFSISNWTAAVSSLSDGSDVRKHGVFFFGRPQH